MKKLIPLLLVLMSVGLHSQEPKYWEKIDFQFDSGIKIIDYNKTNNYNFDNRLIIITDSNQIVYYKLYFNVGIEISNAGIIGDIQDAHIVENDSLTLILILTDSKILYISKDLGESWISIEDVTNVATINLSHFSEVDDIFLISTSDSEIYFSEDYCDIWTNTKFEILGKDIKKLFSTYLFIYALTNNDRIYRFDYDDKIFKFIKGSNNLFDENNVVIKNADVIDLSFESDYHNYIYIYLDSNNTMYSVNYNDDIHQFNNLLGIPDSLSLNITCFTVFDRIHYTTLQLGEIPTRGHFGVVGTNREGLHILESDRLYLTVYSNEFLDKEISAVEVNAEIDPNMCFVGTKDCEVYYSELRLDVIDKTKNNNTQISPQPASTKARLSFTLPSDSRVSVKLYNTLGIEQFVMADDFFSEGENSIPIDVSGLADGMYFVAIQYEGKTVVEKLVVRR